MPELPGMHISQLRFWKGALVSEELGVFPGYLDWEGEREKNNMDNFNKIFYKKLKNQWPKAMRGKGEGSHGTDTF